MTNLIRILLVDDHPIVREGVQSLLSNYEEFVVVGEAEDGETAVFQFRALQPDITLLDIRLPDESGLMVLNRLRQIQPTARILLLTSFEDDEYVMAALQAGAQGYILKNASDALLVQAIRAAHRGERVFSPRVTETMVRKLVGGDADLPPLEPLDTEEIQILHLLADGASNSDIGQALYLSSTSVKRKLSRIFSKMNVQTRAQAAAEAVRRGLI
ncbi:MAG: response regulator transcription factor [Anaerolineales bacterium]|nr:response regulator transcription factor [Anaerolineales bacterium]